MSERRVAVVVGGASGIGAAVAVRLASDGYAVTVGDLVAADGVVAVDVVDEASVSALLDGVVAEHGRLDVAVNSAGVSAFGLVVEHDSGEFRRVLDVNLVGAFHVLKHAGRRMTAGGSIVSLTSLNARQPGSAMAAYCSSKAGLVMLTEVTALELGPSGIRVNAVSPGLVDTPLTAPAMDVPGVRDDYLDNTPLGRAGTPQDVAAAVAFLCSDESSWMTGEVLDLNGGAHLKRYPDLHGHVTRMLS